MCSLLKIWNKNKCSGGVCLIVRVLVSARLKRRHVSTMRILVLFLALFLPLMLTSSLKVLVLIGMARLLFMPSDQEIAPSVSFAAIGLMDMVNSGGAVEQVEIHKKTGKSEPASIGLRVKGSGRFGVYCLQRPLKCLVGDRDTETDFNYEEASGLMTFIVPVAAEENRWLIHIQA